MATSTVRLAAAGDTVAFARIVAAYHADLVRVAYVVTGGDQDLADDAVQTAWSVAWRKLGSLRDPERLKPWLVSVAANEARQQCRRRRRASVVEIDVADGVPAGRDPADRAGELDLELALRHLTADERALLALRYEAGVDSTEIGRLTGRPSATIRWRLARPAPTPAPIRGPGRAAPGAFPRSRSAPGAVPRSRSAPGAFPRSRSAPGLGDVTHS